MNAKTPVQQAILEAIDGRDLSTELMHSAISCLMDGEATDVQIAALLSALRTKGECFEELIGAARAMRERVTRIPVRSERLLDTCGTGGDGLHTFNISTATAIVAAAAGVRIAKHGNRSVSSTSGSADVLEALGVSINLTPEAVGQCVDEIGLGFCFAPLLHGAMRHVAPVRKQLGFRTVFNLLGPLTNPAGAQFQLIGAHHPTLAGKMAQALAHLGCERAIVVSGGDGLDEVSLWGETTVFEIRHGQMTCRKWSAETFDLPTCDVEELRVDSPAASADRIRGVLEGRPGGARDIVLANVAAALLAADEVQEPRAGVERASDAIDSGRGREIMARLVDRTAALRTH